MKKVYFAFLALLLSFAVQAEDYVLDRDVALRDYGSGNNTDIRWSDETAWSPSAPLISGSSGTITIPDGVTLTLGEAFTFNGIITVESGGAIVFDRDQPNAGQLIMDESSEIILEDGSSISSTGPAGDNHNYLQIGDFAIDGSQINSLPSPPFALDVTYTECINSGSTTCEPTILPVTLLYFTATEQATAIEINWAASKAWDFSHYELQRSRNGKDFEWVATIDAEENTDHTTEFSYTDRQPHSGTSYYRLKAVDIDGKYEYKGMEVVQFISKNFEVYPNPVTNGSFKVNALQVAEGARLILRDQTGRIVRSHSMSGQVENISTQGLPAGLYILLIQTPQQSTQSQLLIH